MIGAGAVGAGVVYWLMHWGQHSPWAIVDGDHVELHNTNRCVLFFPDDAGWLGGGARFKSACLAEYLPAVRHIEKWYDEAPETGGEFDTVLVLANERDVRTQVSHRNDPVQFQATTSRNWVAQLHRHIAGVDDCIRCRMLDIRTPNMECSEGATATVEKPQRPDAALPFLSLASGLMLVSKLQHLQLGEFGLSRVNRWDWDFKSTHQMDVSGIRQCRDNCTMGLSVEARRHIAAATCWQDRSGLAAGSSPVAIVEFLLRHLWRNSLYEPSANAGRSPPPRKPTALDMPSIVLSNRPSLGESTRRCYYHAAERWGFFSLLMRSDDGRSKFQRSYHLDQMLWALDRGLPGSPTTATLSRRETRVGESRTETEIRGVPKGMGPTEIAASGATSSVTC